MNLLDAHVEIVVALVSAVKLGQQSALEGLALLAGEERLDEQLHDLFVFRYIRHMLQRVGLHVRVAAVLEGVCDVVIVS